MEQLGVCTGSCIYLIFMCKFMVYSPGSKKVFLLTLADIWGLLSCSFYFKAQIQNCSLLWLDSHCRCNTLTFMYGEYMPLAQNLTTFQTWLVVSPHDLVLFSHTDWHSFSGLLFRHGGREPGLVYWKISLFSTNWKCRQRSPRHSLCGAWRSKAGLTR